MPASPAPLMASRRERRVTVTLLDKLLAVDKTASIRFDTNLYSGVPAEYAQKTLTLVADDAFVRLFDAGREVACHRQTWGRRQIVELAEHRQAILDLHGDAIFAAAVTEILTVSTTPAHWSRSASRAAAPPTGPYPSISPSRVTSPIATSPLPSSADTRSRSRTRWPAVD